MEAVYRNYPDLQQPPGPYHHAVRVGDFLFVSGLTARGTAAEGGDFAAQTDAVFQSLERALRAEGGSLRNIVKLNVFTTEAERVSDYREVAGRYLEAARYPASTLVGVTRLVSPTDKIEIEAIAVLP